MISVILDDFKKYIQEASYTQDIDPHKQPIAFYIHKILFDDEGNLIFKWYEKYDTFMICATAAAQTEGQFDLHIISYDDIIKVYLSMTPEIHEAIIKNVQSFIDVKCLNANSYLISYTGTIGTITTPTELSSIIMLGKEMIPMVYVPYTYIEAKDTYSAPDEEANEVSITILKEELPMKCQYDKGTLTVLNNANEAVFSIPAINRGAYGNITINTNSAGDVILTSNNGEVINSFTDEDEEEEEEEED